MVTADSSCYAICYLLHLYNLSEHTFLPSFPRFTIYPHVDIQYYAIPFAGIAPDAFHVTLIFLSAPN